MLSLFNSAKLVKARLLDSLNIMLVSVHKDMLWYRIANVFLIQDELKCL